jgi:holin-like protein
MIGVGREEEKKHDPSADMTPEVHMIGAITLLLVYQLVGEVLVRGLELPIPGPVVGMGLLFATLIVRKGPGLELRTTSNGLLQHLSLLFVPAGTGVMLHFNRLADEWLPLAAALTASTVLSIAVSALLLNALTRHSRARGGQ